MNCKQGDLALVIRGRDAGKMLTCLELMTGGANIGGYFMRGDIWRVDRPISWFVYGLDVAEREEFVPYCCDALLMPIRPPSEDESESEGRDIGISA